MKRNQRNLITKSELAHFQKYLPAMGRLQIRTDGGAWIEKIDRHKAEVTIEIAEGKYKHMYLDEKTTIDDLKEGARDMGVEWVRTIED